MSNTAVRPTLKGIGDITRRLSQKITPDELDEMFGDDPDSFSLLAVAEAVLPRCPLGIATWLRQPANSAEWAETLVKNEGLHQIAWWTRKVTLGDEATSTRHAWDALQAIRARAAEAAEIAGLHAKPLSRKAPEARALECLKQAHHDEYAQLVDSLRRRHNMPFKTPTTADADKLLKMSDEAFRNAVAQDVRNEQTVDDLAHPAVTPRWHKALVALGALAFDALGLPTEKIGDTADERSFAVPDRWLPNGPLSQKDMAPWVARLTFLTHLRVRLMERARLRQAANREVTDKVYGPAEEHLRSMYFAEYARYRIQESSKEAS